MLTFIWTLIIGGGIGALAGAITHHGTSMGWIANIAAGLVGAWIGQGILGAWGPKLAGMALIPSLVGAIVIVSIASFVMDKVGKS